VIAVACSFSAGTVIGAIATARGRARGGPNSRRSTPPAAAISTVGRGGFAMPRGKPGIAPGALSARK